MFVSGFKKPHPQFPTRRWKKKRSLSKHLTPGDSRMGCTALSPSFHGNVFLWKQGLEQTQKSGGGDFVAGEAKRGEVWMERRKEKKEKHREKENMKKWKKKSNVKFGASSQLMYYQSTNTAYNVSAQPTLNYIFCLEMNKVFGIQVFDIEHDATAEKRREQPHWHSPHSSDGRVQQTLHNCCDGRRLALQPSQVLLFLSLWGPLWLTDVQNEDILTSPESWGYWWEYELV